MPNFDYALMKTLGKEGGWSDDDGGTYRGIARNSNPLWAGWEIIDKYPDKKNLPSHVHSMLDPLVRELYRKEYWELAKCDAMQDSTIAAYVFDMAVQHDPRDAIRILQRAMNRVMPLYPISVDGSFGMETSTRLKAILHDPDGQWELMEKLRMERAVKYADVCIHNPAKLKDLKGWIINRVFI